MKKQKTNIFIIPQFFFKKRHKGIIKPKVYKKILTNLNFYPLGIKALESAKITIKQNESLRRILLKKFKNTLISTKQSLIPNWPISQKGRGVRMGKGKGPVGYWVNRLSAGKISLYLNLPHVLENINFFKKIYKSISKRLNFKNKLVLNMHHIQESFLRTNLKLDYWKLI